jgi:hypothetical protein
MRRTHTIPFEGRRSTGTQEYMPFSADISNRRMVLHIQYHATKFSPWHLPQRIRAHTSRRAAIIW